MPVTDFTPTSDPLELPAKYRELVAFARTHTIDDIDALVMIGEFEHVLAGFHDERVGTLQSWGSRRVAVPGDASNAVLAEGKATPTPRPSQGEVPDIATSIEIGRIYEGTVVRLLDFGAIVRILPGRDGLLHISQITKERVNNVSDYVKEGQVVRVKVLEADEKGRVRLSMRAVAEEQNQQNLRDVQHPTSSS
jgi:predicted RNA-binding protein with RPS1 domain